jgi:hypothetical protein
VRALGYTDADVLQAVRATREAVPRIPEPTPEDYWEFVSRLIFSGSESDRAEFLRRVEALK